MLGFLSRPYLTSRCTTLACSLIVLGFIPPVSAQSDADSLLSDMSPVTDSMLMSPPAEDWLMWRRTYDLSGHSPLSQINRDNVADLNVAWSVELGIGTSMTTTLIHDGVMFIADTENRLLALDATSGEELWRYQHDLDNTDARRVSMALHGDTLVVPHNDLDLVALNARTGEVRWQHSVATPVAQDAILRGYYSLRSGPLVANGMVVQGVAATSIVPEGGFIVGIDLNSGDEMWRFHTVARPDGPGGNTWNNLPLEGRSGGSVWIPGSYDPELDLVYFGTAPTYDTEPLRLQIGVDGVNNDALYTNSTLALRPRTGELAWHFQHMANDQWDLDWAYERQLSELEIDGQTRKAVFTAGKMALYDVLDAATGEYLTSLDTGIQNMIAAIDPESGDKTLASIAIPNAEDTNLLCPYMLGGRNWQSGAFDDKNKMLFLPLSELCMMAGAVGSGGALLTSGVATSVRARPDTDGNFGRVQAMNLETMELAWQHRAKAPATIATLSTDGGLVFTGFLDLTFKALDAETGEQLWAEDLGAIPSSFPVTYAVDGKQYIAVIRGQPSPFFGSLLGSNIRSLLADRNDSIPRPSEGPAMMVFALD
ncbi:MAG: PQQ-binding-like beta-propeller repeat protein [Pseudomonadales bacterium]|nr:PQQ-binding-like beta-propeller repeat protein [Pseudomonadales bacterium]